MARPKQRPDKALSRVAHVRLSLAEDTGLKALGAALDLSPSRIHRRLIREAINGGPDYFADGVHELRLLHVHLAAVAALAEEQAKHQEETEQERPCQALEYARAAATLTAQIPKLETDSRKRAAVQGAVQLAEFGWELSSQDQGHAEDRAEARAVINRAARAIHSHIRGIEAGAEQQAAIQAERRLTGQLQEYRKEQREQAAQARKEREAAEEREEGPERELEP